MPLIERRAVRRREQILVICKRVSASQRCVWAGGRAVQQRSATHGAASYCSSQHADTPHRGDVKQQINTSSDFSRYYSYTHAAPLESFDVSIYIVDVTSLSSNAVTCGLSGVVGGGNHAVGGFQ